MIGTQPASTLPPLDYRYALDAALATVGAAPLAICLQRYVRDKAVFVPPKAPFHTTLDISFTK